MTQQAYESDIPRENCPPEMITYINLCIEFEEAEKVDPLLGDFIELELNAKESRQNGHLRSLYRTLFNQFLIRYNRDYPQSPWVSIFDNQKNP